MTFIFRKFFFEETNFVHHVNISYLIHPLFVDQLVLDQLNRFSRNQIYEILKKKV